VREVRMRLRMQWGAAIAAGALILGLLACEQRPANETAGNEVRGTEPTPVPRVAPAAAPAEKKDAGDLGKLFARMWQVTKAPQKPARGAMWVFLPNGTLLETSCVETYRVAIWSADKTDPRKLTVVEDRQPAFTAEIEELTDQTLRVKQKLTRQEEVQEMAFTGIEGEVVCPDMR
jgi:hypothetical protein